MGDHDGIRRTLAQYCQYADNGNYDAFAALFVSEALYLAPGDRSLVGRAEIRAFIEKALPPESEGRHICTNSVIDVDGDVASATSDFLYLTRDGDRHWTVSVVGRYFDRFARTGDTWLFTERSIALY